MVNVYENSNSQMPLIYRLASIWGNHEGSMMLWVSILTFFGALVAVFGTNLPLVLKANALAVQAWIAAAFHLFILITSNPFLRIADAPLEGQDSIRSCRIPASPSIRRCSISAMSASRSRSPSPSPR